MKNQELAFTSNEGDNWFIRNKNKVQEKSAEITLLCNWLMPYQRHLDNKFSLHQISKNCKTVKNLFFC